MHDKAGRFIVQGRGNKFLLIKQQNIMNEIELITKALKDAYKFVKEQEQTKETGELLIALYKAEILVKNCSIPPVSGQSEKLKAFVTEVSKGFDDSHKHKVVKKANDILKSL